MFVRFLRGELRSGRLFGVRTPVEAAGVLEKNPSSVFCPLADPAFFRVAGPGVLAGALFFGAMMTRSRILYC